MPIFSRPERFTGLLLHCPRGRPPLQAYPLVPMSHAGSLCPSHHWSHARLTLLSHLWIYIDHEYNTLCHAVISALSSGHRGCCRLALAMMTRYRFHTFAPGKCGGGYIFMRAAFSPHSLEYAMQQETAPPDFSSYEGSEPFFITDAHIMCCAFVVLSALLFQIAAKLLKGR